MNPRLILVLGVGLVLFYALLIKMLSGHTLILKYTILWMACAFILVLFLIFPGIVVWISNTLGISNPVNAVFLMFAAVALVILLSLTSIVSQLSSRERRLTQSVALLEERVRRLESGEEENKEEDNI